VHRAPGICPPTMALAKRCHPAKARLTSASKGNGVTDFDVEALNNSSAFSSVKRPAARSAL